MLLTGWLDALLGRIFNNGVALPLSKGINASTGITATFNQTTKVVDLTQDVPGVAAHVISALPSASQTTAGVVELASAGEANALSDTTRALTPGTLPTSSETQKGVVELASAGEANALSDTTRAVSPGRLPLATTSQLGLVEIATGAEVEAETLTGNGLVVCANTLVRHPGVAKVWAQVDGAGSAPLSSYNLTSITDGANAVTFTIGQDFTTANYCAVGTAANATLGTAANNILLTEATAARAAGAFQMVSSNQANPNALAEPAWYQVLAFGDIA